MFQGCRSILKYDGNDGYGVETAIVFSDYNSARNPKVHYLPVYLAMFLEHDQLSDDAAFKLPSMEGLNVDPYFA